MLSDFIVIILIFIRFSFLAERKIQSSNTFHDYIPGNKDVPPIPSKRDPFPENLLNFSKTIIYKAEIDRCSNETLNKSETSSSNKQKDNVELDQNLKLAEHECDPPYSRNSQILMKLCREESVKRLISGWNKAVEQSDDTKNVNKEIVSENDFHTKTPISKKVPEQVSNDRKHSFPNQDSHDISFSLKTESIPTNFMHSSSTASDDNIPNDTFLKTNSPEDTHAGKLVGKATVIRRPSIAKLKALFEKTSQNTSESNESGRRRTLFRSHSHYVSHTSRAFTLSDGSNQHTASGSEVKPASLLKSEENRSERSKTNNQSNVESNHLYNLENLSNSHSGYNSQQSASSDNHEYYQSSDENRKQTVKDPHMSSTEFNRENSHKINCTESSANHSGHFESHFNSDDLNSSTKAKMKQNSNFNVKKEKPPELPMKKKPAISVPQLPNFVEKNIKESESTVPRFKVNVPKENQIYGESSNKLNNSLLQREASSNKILNQVEKSFKENNCIKASVASPDWNSDDSLREYVRRSQDIERHVLHKNQSFSDPEQSARCLEQTAKQATKPKLSLTDQTYPKFTYSAEKGLDEKISFSHECAYMNVNSLAQKNIRQIEEKLKSHPRGAIIDLTSRKSYIDELPTAAEKSYVFRNTVEPVKFLPRQESRDLLSQDKHSNKTEPMSKESSSKSHSNLSNVKSNSSKADSTKNDSDHINSKNLLLHSPPPKSKRGHPSKSSSKLPSVPPVAQDSSEIPSDNSKSIPSTVDKNKQIVKLVAPQNYTSANISQNSSPTTATTTTTTVIMTTTTTTSSTSTHSTPAADRSDPRYFPVTRQTASDARYESEKHKAETREAATGRQITSYEHHYSNKPANTIYHKLPLGYEKPNSETKVMKDVKYTHDNTKSHYDKEPLYGLQRSTSGPQIMPSTSDTSQKISHSSDLSRSYNIYGQIGEDNKISKSFHASETRTMPQYETNQPYSIYGTTGQHNMFPPGPPKPPRTYHYDIKSNQEKVPDVFKSDHNTKRDGGRYIVSVASPKHSNSQNPLPPSNSVNVDYRYDRATEIGHVASKNVYQPQPTYVSPLTNEVHMSRSYPFTNYDRSYYPRPYGKQYYPDSIAFRNVQPVHHVTNNIYAVPDKPMYAHQNIYGTVKHRNTFSDYENVYDAQIDYMHAVSNSNAKSEHQNIYQSINPNSMSGLQYSQSDASVYAVLQTPKSHGQFKSSQAPTESSGNSVPKRVYFDTLQRRNKQHVTWEQRRSHDDMDIRPAPSARLREQIHARRSMVELDNLEISVASDEGKYCIDMIKFAKIELLYNKNQSEIYGEGNDTSREKTSSNT